MKDLHNTEKRTRVISPVSTTGNTAIVGAIIDRKGFDSLEFAITLGTITTAGTTYTALLEESDASDMSGSNAVADVDLIGTEALASFVDSEVNTTKGLGYKGTKRYVRLTMTPAGNTGASTMCAIAIQGSGSLKPAV